MPNWRKLCNLDDLPEGAMVQVEFGQKVLVLARHESKLRAFDAFCPHASAPLVEGVFRSERGYVICPLHHYRFQVATGVCLKPVDGPRLRVYEIEIRGQEVWIRIP